MKANVRDRIQLVEDIRSRSGNRIIPAGTFGWVTTRYLMPKEGYCIELSIPNKQRSGGFDHERVTLKPNQFMVV